MHSENDIDRKNFQCKVEEFLDHSQSYLNGLPIIKRQLQEIDRLNEVDTCIEKLNEFDMSVNQLTEDICDIEQSHSHLNENERSKLDQQIQLLRIDVDREISDLHYLREQMTTEENIPSTDDQNENVEKEEEEETPNVLRQRRVTVNPLDNSYDLLERDLTYLRDRIDEVATLIAEQEQKLSRLEYYKTIAQYRMHNASSYVHGLVQNRYVTTASGALLGAGIGGPVGFVMGTKIGALVALSGSALGALSLNIMRQRVTETDESETNTPTAYNQAML